MTYCAEHDVDIFVANNFAFIRAFTLIWASLATGVVLIPMSLKKRGIFLVASAVFMFVSFSFMFRYVGTTQAVIAMFLAGIANAIFPAIAISISPDVSEKKEYTGITNGFISLGRNLGNSTVGISGAIIDAAGFGALAWVDT